MGLPWAWVALLASWTAWAGTAPSVTFQAAPRDGALGRIAVDGAPLLTGARVHLELTGADGVRLVADEGEDWSALRAARVELRRQFRASAHRTAITAEYELHNTGQETYLVEGWLRVQVDPGFRTGSYYYVPYPQCVPWLDAASVTEPRTLYSSVYAPCHTAACVLVNPARGLGLASYLIRVNGSYTNWVFSSPFRAEADLFQPPISRCNPIATPEGWEHFCHRDFLGPGGRTSFSLRYLVFRGDSAAFLRRALDDPDRHALRPPGHPPRWMQDTMLMMFVTQAPTPDDALRWKRAAEALGGNGSLLPLVGRYAHFGGEYVTDDADAKALRGGVEAARLAYPRVRVGAYVIGELRERTETYRQHPDWVVRDAHGVPPLLDLPDRLIPELAMPVVAGYYREQWMKVVRDLDLDYLYIDGGDSSAFGPADWPHQEVTHYADLYRLACGLHHDLRALTPARALFMNTPGSCVADAMFQEMGPGQWSPEGDWRSRSDALLFARLNAQSRAGVWASPLYPYDLRKYFSQLLALALTPNHPISTDADLAEVTGRWRPYIRAAYALRDCRLVEADLRPSWRRERTDLEGYVLRQPRLLRIMLISHAPEPRSETVSLDYRAAGLGEPPRPQLSAWDMADPGKPEVPQEAFAPVGQLQPRLSGERLALTVRLRPELLTMVVVQVAPTGADGAELQH